MLDQEDVRLPNLVVVRESPQVWKPVGEGDVGGERLTCCPCCGLVWGPPRSDGAGTLPRSAGGEREGVGGVII